MSSKRIYRSDLLEMSKNRVVKQGYANLMKLQRNELAEIAKHFKLKRVGRTKQSIAKSLVQFNHSRSIDYSDMSVIERNRIIKNGTVAQLKEIAKQYDIGFAQRIKKGDLQDRIRDHFSVKGQNAHTNEYTKVVKNQRFKITEYHVADMDYEKQLILNKVKALYKIERKKFGNQRVLINLSAIAQTIAQDKKDGLLGQQQTWNLYALGYREVENKEDIEQLVNDWMKKIKDGLLKLEIESLNIILIEKLTLFRVAFKYIDRNKGGAYLQMDPKYDQVIFNPKGCCLIECLKYCGVEIDVSKKLSQLGLDEKSLIPTNRISRLTDEQNVKVAVYHLNDDNSLSNPTYYPKKCPEGHLFIKLFLHKNHYMVIKNLPQFKKLLKDYKDEDFQVEREESVVVEKKKGLKMFYPRYFKKEELQIDTHYFWNVQDDSCSITSLKSSLEGKVDMVITGEDYLDKFITLVKQICKRQQEQFETMDCYIRCPYNERDEMRRQYIVKFWSHNGGRLDKIKYKDRPIGKIFSRDGLLLMGKNEFVEFRDFYSHCNFELVDLCKEFAIQNQNVVVTIGQCFNYYSKMIHEITGLDAGRYPTAPSMVYKLLIKGWSEKFQGLSTKGFPNQKTIGIVRDFEFEDFVRLSVYGGRCSVQKQEFTSKQFNLMDDWNDEKKRQEIYTNVTDFYHDVDANSLYPSAMIFNKFPIGEPYKIQQCDCERIAKLLMSLKYDRHCIVDVTVTFPSEFVCGTLPGSYNFEEKRGVFNSVDLMEAVRYNCVKIVIHSGYEWLESDYIFDESIGKIIKLRLEAKKNGQVVLSSVLKRIPNSAYGSLLRKKILEETTVFKNVNDLDNFLVSGADIIGLSHFDEEKCFVKYNRERTLYDIDRPSHLGSFVTAYARKIMNSVINKFDGFTNERLTFANTDTDSLHISNEAYQMLMNEKVTYRDSEISIFGEGLGQFSNELPKGSKIVKAVWQSKKVYLLDYIYPCEGGFKRSEKVANRKRLKLNVLE